MPIIEAISPFLGTLKSGFANLSTYAWLLFPLVIVAIIIGIFFIYKAIKTKKSQWTHRLKIRRVLHGGQLTQGSFQKLRLSEPIFINMRRFPLIKNAEVFELEKPLLGGYLLPELDEYSGENEFSIILDVNNRIYTNKGEFFDPDKRCINVSAKHSEIDIQRSNLKADFQNINKVNKRVEWATIAKYAFFAVAIVATMVVLIVGLTKWGEAQEFKAQSELAQAQVMENLADAMKTMEGIVNTQQLQITPMLKKLYGTENIQELVNPGENNENS